MSWRTSSRSRPCCTVPPCLCPPGERGPPGPAGALNAGADLYRAARNAVVAIVLGEGELRNDFGEYDQGSGFWVSPYVVATSWSRVARESGKVRVVVSRLDGPPISIDGVVTYAVPELDVALITVNPAFYIGTAFVPLVLDISTDVSVGDDIFTISDFYETGAVAFHEGSVTTLSYSAGLGYPSYMGVDTYLLAGDTNFGCPFIKDTGYYAALTCGHNVYSACSATAATTSAAASKYLKIVGMRSSIIQDSTVFLIGGATGLQLQAVLSWAASDLGAGVLSAPYAMGSVTIPYLRRSLALGQLVNTVYVPMVTETINKDTFDLGAPQTGAWVSDVTVANDVTTPYTYGSVATYGSDGSVTVADAVRVNMLYLRSETDALSDISSSGVPIDFTTGSASEGWAEIDLGTIFTPPFRVSGEPTGASVTTNTALTLRVSAIGVVTFTTSAFTTPLSLLPQDLRELIIDPSPRSSLYVAPFASTDFILPDGTNYDDTPGAPGFALDVRYEVAGSVLIIQWTGYSQRTGDPVAFQVILTGASAATDPESGQVRFGYLTMPGAWAGSVWLSAHRLTSNPGTLTTRLIQLFDTPVQQDLVYFGSASYDLNVQLVPVTVTIGGSLLTAVGPASPDDTVMYVTIVTEGTAGGFGYSLARYTRDADTRIRVSAVNSVKVADFNANQPSLLDVLIRVASGASSVSPTRVPVALATNNTATSVLATASQVLDMLRSYALLGSPPTVTLLPSNAGVSFAPNGSSSSIYTSAVFTVPAVSVSTSTSAVLLPDILSVTVTLELTGIVPNSTGLMVQLAYTDSTGLVTVSPVDSSSCLVVYADATGNFHAIISNGYGGADFSTTPLTSPTYTTTLFVEPSASEQRPNSIVLGRPPRAHNSATYDPVTPFSLTNGDMTLTDLRFQYYTTVVQTDNTRSYAVTTKDYNYMNLATQ